MASKRLGCLPTALILLAIGVIGSGISGGMNSGQDVGNGQAASDSPSATQATQNSSTQELDKACMAMKSANQAVSEVGLQIIDGDMPGSAPNSLTKALTGLNQAYPELSGDFYWYLVEQGNNVDLLVNSINSNNLSGAEIAINAFLDADAYLDFCK
jgi:hypothetical protein